MPIISQSLTDALKQILQTFQLPFLFPAIMIVLVSATLNRSYVQLDDPHHLIMIVLVTVILSYLLYASNIPLIRFLEGYVIRDSWFFRFLGRFEEQRYQLLNEQIEHCERMIEQIEDLELESSDSNLLVGKRRQRLKYLRSNWELKKAELLDIKQIRFPRSPRRLLPTALGNTIAAFEDYPWDRYRMDSVHLWPRLLPILEKNKFTPFIQNEKSILDFLINSGLAISFIILELIILGFNKGFDWHYWLVSGLLIGVAYSLYLFAITAAKHWGGMVRVAFDLYRNDLRKALHLPAIPDESLGDERKQWQAVSRFLVLGETQQFKGFVYSTPETPASEANQNA